MLTWLQSIWPFTVHVGGATVLIVGLLVAAYFSPILKRDFLWGAFAVFVLLSAYAIGAHDEHKAWKVREQSLIKEVHDAVVDAIRNGKKDPYDDPNL